MLDLGWSELVVVAILTVLIFGPKELPTVLRTVTQFVSKLRGMARDFQRTMDDVAREAELDKLKDDVKDVTNGNSMLDPTGTENDMFNRFFDDDEEEDGTPRKRPEEAKSTSYVPGFDSSSDAQEGQSGDTPATEANDATAAASPAQPAGAEVETAAESGEKKASNA